ncbi:hypothetical protein [Clostridium mobile]|nr:hypothetical protein [Clostridium mobile]
MPYRDWKITFDRDENIEEKKKKKKDNKNQENNKKKMNTLK